MSVHYCSNRIYVVQKVPENGNNHDLYYLKHTRSHFTDAEFGLMASQLISQLTNLHAQNIVYKYLNP